MDDYSSLENSIQYHFKKPDLLREALLAAGAATDKHIDGDERGNKRLALIGDALIQLDIVDRGYASNLDTGAITQIANNRGSNLTLRRIALKKGLEKFLTRNPTEGGEPSTTALASEVEALIGAVWLDSGRDLETVYSVIDNLAIIGAGTFREV